MAARARSHSASMSYSPRSFSQPKNQEFRLLRTGTPANDVGYGGATPSSSPYAQAIKGRASLRMARVNEASPGDGSMSRTGPLDPSTRRSPRRYLNSWGRWDAVEAAQIL